MKDFFLWGTGILFAFFMLTSFSRNADKQLTQPTKHVGDQSQVFQPEEVEEQTRAVSQSAGKPVQVAATPDIPYTVEVKIASNKVWRRVKVHLSRRPTKEQLRRIALEIKASDPFPYKRTLIDHFIPESDCCYAWAITHFNPGLEVNILGVTLEQLRNMTEIQREAHRAIYRTRVGIELEIGARQDVRDRRVLLEIREGEGSVFDVLVDVARERGTVIFNDDFDTQEILGAIFKEVGDMTLHSEFKTQYLYVTYGTASDVLRYKFTTKESRSYLKGLRVRGPDAADRYLEKVSRRDKIKMTSALFQPPDNFHCIPFNVFDPCFPVKIVATFMNKLHSEVFAHPAQSGDGPAAFWQVLLRSPEVRLQVKKQVVRKGLV